LVECIRLKSDLELKSSRDLLITMLRVFTLKFYTISKLQLPLILQKWYALYINIIFLLLYKRFLKLLFTRKNVKSENGSQTASSDVGAKDLAVSVSQFNKINP
jgi:hypothetical protein